MSARIARSEGSTENEVDGIRMSAKNALDHYLALPVVEDTFVFWKNYAVTTDKAQKCLCKLARLYLTPPPTTTGIYLWKLVIFVMLALSTKWQCQPSHCNFSTHRHQQDVMAMCITAFTTSFQSFLNTVRCREIIFYRG